MPILKANPEFLVNTTTLNGQNESNITALSDGRFVVSWTDSSVSVGDTSSSAIRARIFNADGSQSVPEFLVNTTTPNFQSDGNITALTDGRFVVCWTDQSNTGGDTSGAYAIRARIFNADGSQSVPEFLVNTTTLNIQFESRITALADGRFVVSWTDQSNTGGDTSGTGAIRARIFNADGSQRVPEFLVNTTTLNAQFGSGIMTLSDGRFVVSWRDESSTGGDMSGSAIRARIFNADGSQSVPEFLVNTTTTNGQVQSRITALADGRFVVSWRDESNTGGDTSVAAIRARIFNPDGGQSVPEFLVNTTTLNRQSDSSITALADGRFVISWSDQSNTGGDTSVGAIRARIFNADGSQSVPEFLVNTTTLNLQFESSITALADGRFVVSWSDESNTGGDTSGDAIRAQVFDPKHYDGTAAADIVSGGAFDDNYFGYGGDDDISGRGGDDYLNGGTGNDTLAGDAGDDRLFGGNDQDRLFGWIGNDLLRGENGNDTAFGEGGNDTLTGDVGDDQLFGGDDQDRLFGWIGNDLLRGDNGNDTLFGEGGDDTLTGDVGDDQIFGGDDQDRLFGWIGNDLLRGENGNDTLFGEGGNDELTGDVGDDQIFGGDDQDRLFGWIGNDLLRGENGNDTLFGEGGNDELTGDAGNDQLFGGDDQDRLFGWIGNDLLRGENGNDTLRGEGGNDTLTGDVGDDELFGGDDNDELFGWVGADLLVGEAGNDTLRGEADNDILAGGRGNDTLNGGSGADRFYFWFNEIAPGELDRIEDFETIDNYYFQNGAVLSYRGIGIGSAIDVALPGGSFSVDVLGATIAQLQAQTIFF